MDSLLQNLVKRQHSAIAAPLRHIFKDNNTIGRYIIISRKINQLMLAITNGKTTQ